MFKFNFSVDQESNPGTGNNAYCFLWYYYYDLIILINLLFSDLHLPKLEKIKKSLSPDPINFQ